MSKALKKKSVFRHYRGVIWEDKWTVAVLALILAAGVAAHDFLSPRTYMVQAGLLVKPTLSAGKCLQYLPTRQARLSFLRSQAVRQKRNTLSIKDDKESGIVTIMVAGQDPQGLAAAANAWAEEFVQEDRRRLRSAAVKEIERLKEALLASRNKLKVAKKELVVFSENNPEAVIPGEEARQKALLAKLRTEKAQIGRELEEQSRIYHPTHRAVSVLKAQLETVDRKIREATAALLSFQDKGEEYKLLSREVYNYRVLEQELEAKIKEARLGLNNIARSVQFVSPAEPATTPLQWWSGAKIVGAVALGLLFGVLVSFLVRRFDPTFGGKEEVVSHTGTVFLGAIPLAKRDAKNPLAARLVVHRNPHSPAATAFKDIYSNLAPALKTVKPLKSVVVTSALAGEGKTFFASNLAITFARNKIKTLLIDADLRKGRLAQSFGLEEGKGLSGVLSGAASLEKAVMTTFIPELFLLPRGPYVASPIELLKSGHLKDLLRKAEKDFQRVVIDSLPILNVTDALILGHNCEGVIFIIRAHSTSFHCVGEAQKILGNKVRTIGTVLNAVKPPLKV